MRLCCQMNNHTQFPKFRCNRPQDVQHQDVCCHQRVSPTLNTYGVTETVLSVMGVDPCVDRGNVPYFLMWRERPVFCPPVLFRSRLLCTNAHDTQWMIRAIFVKYSQLILTKIIKIVATRCHIVRLKSIIFNFGWGSATDPAGRAYSASQTP